MDDTVVWATAEDLPKLRHAALEILDSLKLRLKNGGEWNRCEQGLPFLGFVIYPDRLRLGRQGRRRLRRKFRACEREWRDGTIDEATLEARTTALFAHARHADDLAWRRTVLEFSIYDVQPGETQEPRPRPAGRVLEQQGQELPLGHPQQEQGREPQQEPRLPSVSRSRHGESEQQFAPPDDAPSRACRDLRRDESSDKTSADGDVAGEQQ